MAVTRLKVLRVLEGISQLELAAKTGIDVSVISQLENGWRIPKPDQLKKLAEVLPELNQRGDVLIKVK